VRNLSLLDVLIVAAVLGLLVFAARQDFVHYNGRSPAPVAAPPS